MQENNNQNCQVCGSGNGRCGRCGNMCGFNGHHILRWVLGILIITWVFCIGVRFGEFKASFENGSSYGYRYGRVMPMMGGAWGNAEDTIYFSQAVPATQTTGAVKIIKSN